MGSVCEIEGQFNRLRCDGGYKYKIWKSMGRSVGLYQVMTMWRQKWPMYRSPEGLLYGGYQGRHTDIIILCT